MGYRDIGNGFEVDVKRVPYAQPVIEKKPESSSYTNVAHYRPNSLHSRDQYKGKHYGHKQQKYHQDEEPDGRLVTTRLHHLNHHCGSNQRDTEHHSINHHHHYHSSNHNNHSHHNQPQHSWWRLFRTQHTVTPVTLSTCREPDTTSRGEMSQSNSNHTIILFNI